MKIRSKNTETSPETSSNCCLQVLYFHSLKYLDRLHRFCIFSSYIVGLINIFECFVFQLRKHKVKCPVLKYYVVQGNFICCVFYG